MKSETVKRDSLIDIVKAIGIISIVIGHASWSITNLNIKIGPFVYTYHLMIFIFASGFVFNTRKADEDSNYKYSNYCKQLIRLLIMYFTYNVLFVLLHNLFVSTHIIDGEIYNKGMMVKNILNALTFNSSERLLGPFWFVPMLLSTRLIFTITYNKELLKKWYRVFAIIIVFAVIGVVLCTKNIGLNYKIQISLLSVPFIYFGVLTKKYWKKVKIVFAPWSWLISMIIIIVVLHLVNANIELSINNIINPFIFYPLSLVGIHFCLSLANMFNKIKYIKNGLATVGKYSFHVMALHVLVIKIIDIIYSKINGITDIGLISHFPNSYSKKLFLVYYVLAVTLPTIIIFLYAKIKNYIIRRLHDERKRIS